MTYPHRASVSRAALIVNLLAASACTETRLPSPGAPLQSPDLAGPFARVTERSELPSHPGYVDLRVAGRVSALGARGLPAPAPDTLYVLDQLTSPVVGARFDDSVGDRMDDALAAAEDDGRPVDTYGTGVLTLEELLGDDVHEGACEIPRLIADTVHEGEPWEMTLGVAMIENILGELVPAMGTLPGDCVDALVEAAGDIDAAGDCSTTDEAAFFPEGSDCRACLEGAAGDYAGCVNTGACAAEAVVMESEGGRLWSRLEDTVLTCAPDHTVPGYVLADLGEDGALPDPFDYDRWGYLCVPFGDGRGDVTYSCAGGDDTMRVGANGLVEGMRREGDDTP
jgi:hypothetical protein